MSQEPTTRPSQFRITEMLAEVESRQKRATRHWLLLLLAPLLVGACLLVYTSYAVSKRLRQIGELDAQIAARQSEIADKDRIIAERNRQLENKEQVIQAKTEVISKVYEQATDPGARARILSTIESNLTAAAATPRVFIHYPDAGQKGLADALRAKVRQLGYVVPATELVPAARPNPEVRYFFPDDRAAAERVAEVIAGQRVGLRVAQRNAPGAKPGLVEVWLPASLTLNPDTPARRDEAPKPEPDVRPTRPARTPR